LYIRRARTGAETIPIKTPFLVPQPRYLHVLGILAVPSPAFMTSTVEVTLSLPVLSCDTAVAEFN
jgi:hypothetical protein